MKLSELTSEPKLIELTIDDKATIKAYGEPIVFYTYDRQPMEVFMKLVNVTETDSSKLFEIIKTLVLDEDGNQILADNKMLPTSILMAVITKVTQLLGK